MPFDRQLDTLITKIAAYDRQRCIDELARIRRPPLDFTEEFLRRLDVEHLRHVLVAACLQSRKAAGGGA